MRTQLIGPQRAPPRAGGLRRDVHDHGITMIFLFVIPMTTGAFGNYLLPLMIGARDMAFPRHERRSPSGSSSAPGCFIYVSPGLRPRAERRLVRLCAAGLQAVRPRPQHRLLRLRVDLQRDLLSTAAAINFIVTIFKLRAPGMSLNRMPLFCFAFLAAAFSLVFALPALTVGLRSSSSSTGSSGFTSSTSLRRPCRCCGKTCSGSSATPRSTSSSCRPSGSRPRSSRRSRSRRMVALPAGRAGRAAGRVPRLRRLGPPHVRDRPADDRRLSSSPPRR